MSDMPALAAHAMQSSPFLRAIQDHGVQQADLLPRRIRISLTALAQLNIQPEQPCGLALQQLSKVSTQPELLQAMHQFQDCWLHLYSNGFPLEDLPQLLQSVTLSGRLLRNRTAAFRDALQQWMLMQAANTGRFAFQYADRHHQCSGLPNRTMLLEHLDQRLSERAHDFGLLLLSLRLRPSACAGLPQRMPDISSEIVARLQQALPNGYQLYQIENDVFAILTSQLQHSSDLDLLAARVRRPFELSVSVNQHRFALTPLIALIDASQMRDQAKDVLIQAMRTLDMAFQERQTYTRYRPDIEDSYQLALQTGKEVVDAFDKDRISLFLQPVIELLSGQCVGAEALLRCYRDSGEMIPPPVAIDTLYAQGLGQQYLRWMINTACRLVVTLRERCTSPVFVAINLDAEDLANRDLPFLLSQAMALWGTQGSELLLEITEGGLMSDIEVASDVLQACSALGCKVALDDFGTGYSSMSRLRHLPIDTLKIDQSFVRHVCNSEQDAAIVKSIVDMAHALGKNVVAEGVEDRDSAERLRAMGCDKVQGYHYAKPMAFEAFLDWIQPAVPASADAPPVTS